MALINCRECGQQISDSASVCPHCGATVVKEVFCSNCGAKMPQDMKYCPQCGCPNPASPEKYPKEKLVSGLLAIFLGGLGIHYFYLGKSTAGLITILLTLCTCGIWPFVMLIQGIIMLTMDEGDFNEKYYYTEKKFPLF
ncbi:MAG TPA: TM2 domain-containing protein [Candidatus Coprenecus stercoravium]|uniref:TM2 domain-containing protein n=1 Tax=Candidatus Coprenecus stercoravium TaxID=2840735 RepID=A0A9D2K9W4_9BACT|nr:TM2 domain-containing protein [Candidatus Coprenecus stercoravium]